MDLDDKIKLITLSTLRDLNECFLIANAAVMSILLSDYTQWSLTPKDEEERKIMDETAISIRKNCSTMIPKWAFINFVTILEAWLSDVLREILRTSPHKIRKEMVDSAIVIDSSSYEECLEKLIDYELTKLSYASTKKFTKHLQEITSTDIGGISELLDVLEFKATRNVLLHNKGIVDKTYLQKAGDKARANEGEEIKIDQTAFMNSHDIITTFIKKISDGLVQQYKK